MIKEVKAKNTEHSYKGLINSIGKILEEGRRQTFKAVNTILIKT